VLVPETEEGKKLKEHHAGNGSMINGDLQPHQFAVDAVIVNSYRDMSQPGKYTIQVQEGKVGSNIVRVTVTPKIDQISKVREPTG
jgi:hypothetical protein